MAQTIAVILAGTLRPSPLREALDVPVLCLPIGTEGNLLDRWSSVVAALGGVQRVEVVVNSQSDQDRVQAAIEWNPTPERRLTVIAEPAAWRGTGGILRDVVGGLAGDDQVLVIEGACLPPSTLGPLREAMTEQTQGVVGICGADEPAGVSIFRRLVFDVVPEVGYYDVKEQLLPALHTAKQAVFTAWMGDTVYRVRDLQSYLAAVRESLACDGQPGRRISDQASVSGSAVLEGSCLIEAGAVIEDGAVIHDSVVLSGATVGGGAVVSRSVVGPMAEVPARSRLLREVRVVRGRTGEPSSSRRGPG
jgi:NDP-sugar pyrophosphorylase family protein